MKKLLCFLLAFSGTFSGLRAQEKDTLKAADYFNMSFTELMEVQVISASKTAQQIKDVSATVQVITAEQIKTRGYFTLEEALADLPGFQFRNINGFNSYVFMRGVPSQNNLILLLVDGVQINELNSGGFYGGGQYDLSNIERIEIVYGPASALYGTNAVSGVINLISKAPAGKHDGHLDLQGGNFKSGMTDFNYRNFNTNKDFGFAFSGMYKTSEKADLGGEEGDNNWTDDMENFENDLSLSARAKFHRFSAGLTYKEKWSSMTTNFKSIGDKYLDKNTLWDIAFFNGFLKYSNAPTKKYSFNSTLYYRNSTVKPNTIEHIEKATDSTSGSQFGYYRPNQLIGWENQIGWKVAERLNVIGGIIGETEQLSDGPSLTHSNSQNEAPVQPSAPDMLVNYLFSYYAQADVEIYKNLAFTGGIHHDISSYYGQVFTPRTGLVFNRNRLNAKLLYNSAFRAPKPWDYSFGTGNSDLKPERMQSFELSGSYLIMKQLSVSASIYKNRIKDKLTIAINGDDIRWVNKSKLNTLGIEVFSDYTIRNFALNVNYTYTDTYDQDGICVPEISMHTANAGITYSYDSHFKINLRTNYIGARKNPTVIPSTGDDMIGDALLFHGCISYLNLKGFDFQLKVNNIFNKEYYHPSNRFAGRYRQPQRMVMLMLGYSF